MATLYPENQQYIPKGGSTASSAFLPGLMKKLQENIRKSTADNMQKTISSDFVPQYGTPADVGKNVLDRFKQGGLGFKTGEQIAPPSGRYEPIPSYEQFLPTDVKETLPRWVSPTEEAKISNLPTDLGGGQYVIDPSQAGKLIKSERTLVDYGFKNKLLGGLPSKHFQVDHIIPLWAGGSDTVSNLQNLDLPTHQIKTNTQAVPLTLLASGKIDINRARMMALTWKDKDASNLPNVGDNGMYSVDFAEKVAKQWEEQASKPKPVTFKEVYKGIPKAMQEFGKGWLPTPVREFIKQGVSGLTAGIVPAPVSEEAGVVSKIAGTAGHIAGTIYGLGKFGKILGLGKNAILAKRGTALANDAMKAANLAIDAGRPISTFTKMRHSATLLSLWGQIGLTGRELTKQQEVEAKNHMTQFLGDVAFGSLLGASGQTVRGYAQVGLGTTALSLMGGNDIEDALKDGALMTALHTLGYKGRFNEINEITYKRSAATLNEYLGDIVPPVKKGQNVPGVLKLDIPAVEQMRQQMQAEYPNDPRVMNVPEIKGENDAIDFLTRAALIRHGDMITNSIKKTDIPQEMIDAEIRRIGTAGVQLYNQTLSPELRIQKQMQDMQSLAEQLKPQIPSEQLKQRGPDINEITQKIPLKFQEQIQVKPEGVVFPEGNIPITGYSSNIDPVSKSNIENLDKARGPHISDRIIFINDPKTNSVMRLINTEASLRGEKPPITNPENTLRAYYIEETPTGRELKPVGYAATAERIGSREFNINKNYDEMIERIKTIIEKAESPEKLMEKLNKDKSQPKVDETMAQELFSQKQAIKDLEDTALLTAIKATTPLEKYDINLNNSPIAEAMRQNGLTFLTGNINKLTKTQSGEPFLVLSIKDQNWLESMVIRDKKPSPVQETIKEITERKKAIETTERLKEVKEMVKKPKQEKLPIELSSKTPVSRLTVAPEATFAPKGGKVPPRAKTVPTEAKMTQIDTDRALYKRLSERVDQIVKKATTEGRLPEKTQERKAITVLNRKMVELIKKYQKTTPQITQKTKIVSEKDALLKDALVIAEDAMANIKGGYFEGERKFVLPLRNATRGAELMIKNNKLKLSPIEQKNLESDFRDRIDQMIKEETDIAKREIEILTEEQKKLEDIWDEDIFGEKPLREQPLPKRDKDIEPLQKTTHEQEIAKNFNLKLKKEDQYILFKEEPEFTKEFIKQNAEKTKEDVRPSVFYGESFRKELNQLTRKEDRTPIDDQRMAKKYGLKLNKNGYLLMNEEPVFADPKNKKSPYSVYGSFLKKEIDMIKKNKTREAEKYIAQLDTWSKTNDVLSLFPKTTERVIKEVFLNIQPQWKKIRMNLNPGKNFSLNSLLKQNSDYVQNLFRQVNPEGHYISEPVERIIAKVEGKSVKKIKEIERKVIEIEEEMKDLRSLERTTPYEDLDIAVKTRLKDEGVSEEDWSRLSLREEHQAQKVQDLIFFEWKFPSMIYKEITGKNPPPKAVIEDGIEQGKDIVRYLFKKTGTRKQIKVNWNKIKEDMQKEVGRTKYKRLKDMFDEIYKTADIEKRPFTLDEITMINNLNKSLAKIVQKYTK